MTRAQQLTGARARRFPLAIDDEKRGPGSRGTSPGTDQVQPRSLRARRHIICALVVLSAAGCPGGRGAGPHLGGVPDEVKKPIEIESVEKTITFPVGEDTAELGAVLTQQKGGVKGPAILIVPGGGEVSRKGTRPSDGVTMYEKPIDVSAAWADAFAMRGALALRWDKRTCGPNDDAICKTNPQADIDAEGPVAMAKDVDAACALIRTEPNFDGRIVLFAHGQAAQVALSSQCAKEAAVIALVAPIPRAIDEAIVAGIKDRVRKAERAAKKEKDEAAKQALLDKATQLRNLAEKNEASFAAIKAGRFAKEARVSGATVAFWKGWMDLTGKTAALVDQVPTKKVVVLGEGDLQYGEKDRVRIQALAPDAFVLVKGADHHLLSDGALDEKTVDAVGKAIEAALGPPQT